MKIALQHLQGVPDCVKIALQHLHGVLDGVMIAFPHLLPILVKKFTTKTNEPEANVIVPGSAAGTATPSQRFGMPGRQVSSRQAAASPCSAPVA